MRREESTARFSDRADGGRRLGQLLTALELRRPFVLGLPRGGVPVGFEVAALLGAPLDVLVARKVGAPGHVEFGIGAIAEGHVHVADGDTLRALGIDDDEFERLARAERPELDRRVATYRGHPLPVMTGRDVVLVDDGLATGVTAEAAVRAARLLDPARVVLAVPVAASAAVTRLEGVADVVVCVASPRRFSSVGEWYEVFDQTSDREVVDLLRRASR
jgi:putative phosphoribosyl transferase